MKKAKLYLILLIGLGFPFVYWARALVPGLPGSVYLYELGRLLGLMAFIFLFFQYLLSARIKVLERGIGLDTQLRLHKRFGLVALSLALTHPVSIFVSERLQAYATPFGVLKLIGLFTLLVLCGTVLVALFYHKLNLTYDRWKRFHTLAFILFPLGFVHSFFLGTGLRKGALGVFWIILAGCYLALIAHRIWKDLYLRRHPHQIQGVSQETPDTWTLSFEGRHRDFLPGQFMLLQIKDRFPNEVHPFTIASSPTQKCLSISVKAVGDFTSSLSDVKIPSMALIDRPYGTFSFLNYPAEELVFVAGGIGVTPFMSMLRYLRDTREDRPVLLLWANKTEKDIAFRQELDEMKKVLPVLEVVHVLSRQDDWPGEKGRISVEILRRYVKDFGRPHFFICGPPPLMHSVKLMLRGLEVPRNKIHLERFALR